MTERTDLLISRVLDASATPAEWEELCGSASYDPDLWRALAMRLRDHTGLGRAVGASIEVAEAIDAVGAPSRRGRPALPPGPRAARRRGAPGRSLGWVLSACLALAWTSFSLLRPDAMRSAPPLPGGADEPGTEDLLQAYVDRGRREGSVVADLPERILLDTRPMPAGEGLELLYLRQILERAVVPELYEFSGQDEAGRAIPVRYERREGPPM
jgi:hypothetical protein